MEFKKVVTCKKWYTFSYWYHSANVKDDEKQKTGSCFLWLFKKYLASVTAVMAGNGTY